MTGLVDDAVTLPGGPRLALRRAGGPRRPFLLVHGLASNARLWDGVAGRLAAAGHEAVAVDLRGHGRSEEPAAGYDTETCAADLASLCRQLGLTGDRAPVVAGQSWGGNVALALAAQHGGVAAIALVDGGWLRPRDRFPTFAECWRALAPPSFEGMPMAELRARSASWHPDWPEEGRAAALANFVELPDGTVRARLARSHHESIVRSLWEGDPARWYPLVAGPALLVPAVGDPPSERDAERAAAVEEALAALPRAEVAWYRGADHDLHAQQPERLCADLLRLAARAEELL
ncbi:MAG: alpha/beta fold hydrolase [Frankiaceae bacterium]